MTTIREDSTKPCCPVIDQKQTNFCSVSHDKRFTIAVAADQPVGVDVEIISSKVLNSAHIYMSYQEEELVRQSAIGESHAATRIWSIKEVVAKATGTDLATAWRQTQVQSIGEHESLFEMDDRGLFTAIHTTIDEHLFTLFL